MTGKKFLDSSDELIEKTIAVNTMSHFWVSFDIYINESLIFLKYFFIKKLAKSFLPAMIEKNHGHIVTIASMAGIAGAPGLGDYCAR